MVDGSTQLANLVVTAALVAGTAEAGAGVVTVVAAKAVAGALVSLEAVVYVAAEMI